MYGDEHETETKDESCLGKKSKPDRMVSDMNRVNYSGL